LAARAGACEYIVGKVVADNQSTGTVTAYGINCSVVQSIVPFGVIRNLKDFGGTFRWCGRDYRVRMSYEGRKTKCFSATICRQKEEPI
jgi:hypothetical protein